MKLRDLILHNFRLKLFSVLLAALIWETIHLATQRQSRNREALPDARTNQLAR
jgi:hypothetical protein